ncbi:UvrB/UvrC motif-containing protein [Geomicrobium sp. JSM 1781026]|uniref:UvrB/UvrC motif-containing protein n=1 Tax=Geomicrobium sp. JSM 1781026 TaxID=3344580 RepID=UPI0035C00D32
MLCQQCEERRATLKFTKVVNGQKTEKHLCEFCAKEKGEALPGTNSYSIHDLLSGMLNLDPSEIKANSSLGSLSQVKKQKPDLACPKCSLKYKAFVQNSRFGCSYCYKAFEEKLEPILKRVHGGNHVHRGKIPKRVGGRLEQERKITKLQESMQGYIQKEEFEQAAMIRDEIRQLRSAVDKGDDE